MAISMGAMFTRFPGPVLAGVPGFSDVRLTGAHYDLVVVHLRALGADWRLLGTLPGGYGWGRWRRGGGSG
jgi:hypothetical protein